MKRLRRWLFNLAAVVSAGLCLACILAGAYSFWYVERIDCSWRGFATTCCSVSGGILIEWTTSTDPSWAIPSARFPQLTAQARVRLDALSSPQPLSSAAHGFLGLRWERQYLIKRGVLIQGQYFDNPVIKAVDSPVVMPEVGRGRRGTVRYRVNIPWWMPTVMMSVLPLAWNKSRRNGRHAPLVGLCTTCRYDLRATPEQCPECGAVPDAAEARRT